MPVEWKRKSWGAGQGGWPTFGADGKVVKDEQEQEERDDERE